MAGYYRNGANNEAGFSGYVDSTEVFDYRQKTSQLQMDQEELSSERMSVAIQLSTAKNINTIKNILEQCLQDFECEEQGTVITVSGYPPNTDFDADNVLAVVQKYDSKAIIRY